MNKSRTKLLLLVSQINPSDASEAAVIADVARWLGQTDDVWRRQAPDVPGRHLVSYCVLVDKQRQEVLLMHHRKAGLWLPSGGHIEPHEDPRDCAERELAEELGLSVAATAVVADLPLFITSTRTRGSHSHEDTSFWYVVAADREVVLNPDPREFTGWRWETYEQVLAREVTELDPHMHRFLRKLQSSP